MAAHLKEVLTLYGKTPTDWELFRGDSFQLRIKAQQALWVALHIKAGIRQLPGLDVRMGIGIGETGLRRRQNNRVHRHCVHPVR